MSRETPSSIMYADLRYFGRIANRDAAHILLSGVATYGGLSPRDRANEPTFLSRRIVNVEPGRMQVELFSDFQHSTQSLLGHVITNLAGDKSSARARATVHYQFEAADCMMHALTNFGLDAYLYRNAIERIRTVALHQESDRTLLYFMLFVVTGCLGDPRRSVAVVERFIADKLAASMSTEETEFTAQQDDGPQGDADSHYRLGLIRIIDGAAKPTIYPLSTSAEGTIIGSLATASHIISDVDHDVSRNHLRIWQQGRRWFAQGLGSTNGTRIISGLDRTCRVVEATRRNRSDEMPPPPVEIHNSDILCLGATTQFLVMRVTDRSGPISEGPIDI